jgi:nucleoside 2-deoxyribosyltransferase
MNNMAMMRDLNGVRIYLSGPIDRVTDDGLKWRKEFKKLCHKFKLPVDFLDPTDKPEWLGSEIGEEKNRVRQLMKSRKWEMAQSQSQYFRHIDLRMVDSCHLFIVWIDITSHLCGTYNELFTAEDQKKPMMAIMADGQSKWDIPSWLVSIFNEDEVFESVEECVEHLKFLHEGKITFDDRWIKI